MDQEQKLSAQEKLEQRAFKLQAKLAQATNRLKQLKARHSVEAKKKRDRALYNLAGIWAMVDEGMTHI